MGGEFVVADDGGGAVGGQAAGVAGFFDSAAQAFAVDDAADTDREVSPL